jgi:hypothetical protein
MRLLKPARLFLIPMVALLSCAPQAALTPQAAFHDLKEAFRKSDAALLERQLSRESVRKIRYMTGLFSRMEERQLKALSDKFNVPAERLKKLTVRDYCALTLSLDRSKNVIGTAASRPVVGIDRRGSRAVIRVDNGMELPFIKEGPYWKFDMTGF